jgi:hypothetical protein
MTDQPLKLFIPITKVDAEKRLVYGVATAEKPDTMGEVCDYASTKPLYEKWSGGIAKATDGKSVGNLRSMHSNIAAGKLTSIAFNDDEKQIEICAKVVDDDEWLKVAEGVYTGFSQGGKYVKRWKDPADPELTRYTADPIEVSLVDLPCLPEATFTMIKAGGATEVRHFKAAPAAEEAPEPTAAAVAARAAELAKAAGDETKWPDQIEAARADLKKCGCAEHKAEAAEKAAQAGTETPPAAATGQGADNPPWEQVWKCKVDGSTHATKAALREHLAGLDARKAADAAAAPVAAKLAEITAALDAKDQGGAAKADEKPAEKSGDAKPPAVPARAATRKRLDKVMGGGLAKGASLYSVSSLLQLLAAVECAEEAAEGATVSEYFSVYSTSGSTSVQLPKELTNRFGALVVELGDIAMAMLDAVLAAMKEEEADEAMRLAAPAVDLIKAGARNSKADGERIQKVHDHSVELGAMCKAADKAAAPEDLAKITAERDALTKSFGDLAGTLDEVLSRVKRIEAQPMPGGPVLKVQAISKERDGGGDAAADFDVDGALSKMTDADRATLAIRLAQSMPRKIGAA